MNNENVSTEDTELCNESLDVVRKCADHCRDAADKAESLICKSTLYSVAFCCEGAVKTLEKCIELCHGTASTNRRAEKETRSAVQQ